MAVSLDLGADACSGRACATCANSELVIDAATAVMSHRDDCTTGLPSADSAAPAVESSGVRDALPAGCVPPARVRDAPQL